MYISDDFEDKYVGSVMIKRIAKERRICESFFNPFVGQSF